MYYKTMVLELLQQYPEVHDRLRSQRKLLPALDRYAGELKTRHDTWKEVLSQANPGSGESQVASEALEIALKELAYHFDSGSPSDPDDQPSIKDAMAYRGLRFGLVLHPQFPPDVYLEGAAARQSMLSREHRGPRAVLNALERLAGGYGPECDRVRQDLGIAEGQLRDYQARLGAPFPHDAYPILLVPSSVTGNFNQVYRAMGHGTLDAVDSLARVGHLARLG